MQTPHYMAQMDTPWQPHASADASRVSTRRGEWVGQMTNAVFYSLEVDLDSIRYAPLTYTERAVLATSFVDAARDSLWALGVFR